MLICLFNKKFSQFKRILLIFRFSEKHKKMGIFAWVQNEKWNQPIFATLLKPQRKLIGWLASEAEQVVHIASCLQKCSNNSGTPRSFWHVFVNLLIYHPPSNFRTQWPACLWLLKDKTSMLKSFSFVVETLDSFGRNTTKSWVFPVFSPKCRSQWLPPSHERPRSELRDCCHKAHSAQKGFFVPFFFGVGHFVAPLIFCSLSKWGNFLPNLPNNDQCKFWHNKRWGFHTCSQGWEAAGGAVVRPGLQILIQMPEPRGQSRGTVAQHGLEDVILWVGIVITWPLLLGPFTCTGTWSYPWQAGLPVKGIALAESSGPCCWVSGSKSFHSNGKKFLLLKTVLAEWKCFFFFLVPLF